MKAGSEKKTIWSYYENDSSIDSSYGKLYNWYAVNDPRGLVPEGWHVPSNGEFDRMTKCLDASVDTTFNGWVGSNIGIQLKSESGWYNNGNGSNSSGFSGLPGGFRNSNGPFDLFGSYGLWWSSTEDSTPYAWSRNLNYNNGNVDRYTDAKRLGFSVRCLRD